MPHLTEETQPTLPYKDLYVVYREDRNLWRALVDTIQSIDRLETIIHQYEQCNDTDEKATVEETPELVATRSWSKSNEDKRKIARLVKQSQRIGASRLNCLNEESASDGESAKVNGNINDDASDRVLQSVTDPDILKGLVSDVTNGIVPNVPNGIDLNVTKGIDFAGSNGLQPKVSYGMDVGVLNGLDPDVLNGVTVDGVNGKNVHGLNMKKNAILVSRNEGLTNMNQCFSHDSMKNRNGLPVNHPQFAPTSQGSIEVANDINKEENETWYIRERSDIQFLSNAEALSGSKTTQAKQLAGENKCMLLDGSESRKEGDKKQASSKYCEDEIHHEAFATFPRTPNPKSNHNVEEHARKMKFVSNHIQSEHNLKSSTTANIQKLPAGKSEVKPLADYTLKPSPTLKNGVPIFFPNDCESPDYLNMSKDSFELDV